MIEHILEGVEGAEPLYRLVTTILDHDLSPVRELASLDHERWEIETPYGEFREILPGKQQFLWGQGPKTATQEFHAPMLAHFATRKVMREAAAEEGIDPDRLSFSHTVRVLRRLVPIRAALPRRNR